MIGLLQRVSEASVAVDGRTVAAIDTGLAVLVAVEKTDTEAAANRLLERLLGYRVFPDAEGRMNVSVRDAGGGLLLVPQFTLAADTRKGMRPSFASAAPPEHGERMFEYLLEAARALHNPVAAGQFGADMQLRLVNEGPVTFSLRATG